jgi:hypothetical protein
MHNLLYYLISSPLSVAYTLLLGLSMTIVFDRLGIYIFRNKVVWVRSMYFFTGLMFTANAILLLAAFSFVNTAILQLIGLLFVLSAAGCVIKMNLPSKLRNAIRFVSTGHSKVFIWLIAIVLVSCCILSLAPPTDADSLDYHLGVPVEILNIKSIWINKDNLHFRLFGFGEMLNVLGLANGCAQFGSFIQYISLLWMVLVFASVLPNKSAVLMVLSVPVLLFLVPSQKHQLTGIACTTICFTAIYKYPHLLHNRTLFLLICTLLFAAGIKYSFLLSVTAVICFLLLQTRKPVSFLTTLLPALLLIAPLYIIKYIHYHDPISPLLESYHSNADVVVARFAWSLKYFSESPLPFPLRLLMPKSLGTISTILGVCLLLIPATVFYIRQSYNVVATIALFIILTVCFGQSTARFFIEPFLWSAVLVFSTPGMQPIGVRIITTLCKVQFFILVPLFIAAAGSLGRGIISNKMRHSVMSQYAVGYNESLWIDSVLPKEAVICTDLRSRSLFSNRYFPLEYMTLQQDAVQLDAMLHKEYKVNYLVLKYNCPRIFRDRYAGAPIIEKVFDKATRNPLNKKKISVTVYEVKQ